uniref:Sulfotransferase n=1 Tax=Leersia perrieri TaxID=77586 RepID=A0A0D9XWR7_9ORYZ
MASSILLSSAPEVAEAAHKKIYDQLRQVVETFPTVPSGIGIPYSRHPDGWYMTTPGVVSSMVIKNHLMTRATDIFLVTFPKSGTAWIKALLYAALHRGADELVAHSPHQLVPFLESQLFIKDRIPDLSSLPAPRPLNTHIPRQSLPDSVAASGSKVVLMPWDIDEAHRQFCDEHVLGYWRWHVEKPNQVLFMTYEELAADTLGQLRRLAQFVGHPFTAEEQEAGVDRKIVKACAMKNLSGLEVNQSGTTDMIDSTVANNIFFRRGVVGD